MNNRQAQEEVTVVCTAEQRRAMIAARERFLKDEPKSPPLTEGAKTQPGHIGRTIVPGEDKQSDAEQALVPGGATFTPYWEPAGWSEEDLYRR